MTYKKLILTLCFLLSTSCGKDILINDGSGGNFDPALKKKVEQQYCSMGRELKELANGTDVLFSELSYRSHIFAFSLNTGDICITKANVNETWTENGKSLWFNLNPNSEGNCLPNNSIWEVTNSHLSGGGQYFYLRNLADASQRLLEMNAHQLVRGTHARERVGLKIMACQ